MSRQIRHGTTLCHDMQLDSGKETITRLRTELQSKSSASTDPGSAESHKTLEELKTHIQQVLVLAKLLQCSTQS